MSRFDPRIVRVGVEVDGQIKTYGERFDIRVSGSKMANPAENACEVTITNLTKETRNYILTETSPFNRNRTPKRLFVEIGRVSSLGAQPGSGQAPLTRIFVGEIVSSSPSQPPDIALTIKALTKTYDKGIVVARNGQERELLSAIAARVASDLALSLDFQATDKTIANYAFTGAKLRQVDHLELAGGVDCFVDDDKLVVKDAGAPLVERVTTLSARSGLVGVPEATERGVKVTFMLDSAATLGGALKLESELNPALSGDYTIFKLDFEAATRDTPFYWMAEASRNGYTPPKDPPTRRRRAGAPT